MKKLFNLIALLAIVAMTASFVSCGDNDDDNNDDDNFGPPTLTMNNPNPIWDSLDVTVLLSQTFDFSAASNAESGANLTTAKVDINYGPGIDSTVFEESINATTYSKVFKYQIPNTLMDGDVLTVTITVTDANNKSASQKYYLLVIDKKKMSIFRIKMSAQNLDSNNFFAAAEGRTINKLDGQKNQAMIDMIYYYDFNGGGFASPTNAKFDASGEMATLLIHTWAKRRKTEFKKLAFGTDNAAQDLVWDTEVTDYLKIESKYSTGGTASDEIVPIFDDQFGNLRSYIGFKTTDGILGIIKVLYQEGSSFGLTTVDLEVKVQKL